MASTEARLVSDWLKEQRQVIFDPTNPPPCSKDPELFHSGFEDGREEVERVDRESLAGLICGGCPGRLPCLYRALVTKEQWGVWGGMGEGMRRSFRKHLTEEGYSPNEAPRGPELQSALASFYFYQDTPAELFHGYEPAQQLQHA